jgi:hypothetical protein
LKIDTTTTSSITLAGCDPVHRRTLAGAELVERLRVERVGVVSEEAARAAKDGAHHRGVRRAVVAAVGAARHVRDQAAQRSGDAEAEIAPRDVEQIGDEDVVGDESGRPDFEVFVATRDQPDDPIHHVEQ